MMDQNHIEQAEKLIECLRKRNYFNFPKRKQKKVWKRLRTQSLFRCAIVVEKSFNVDRATFEYRPEEGGVLVRTNFTGRLENQTKEIYDQHGVKCSGCKNPCYLGKYTTEDFIDLINRGVFEPVDLYFI